MNVQGEPGPSTYFLIDHLHVAAYQDTPWGCLERHWRRGQNFCSYLKVGEGGGEGERNMPLYRCSWGPCTMGASSAELWKLLEKGISNS